VVLNEAPFVFNLHGKYNLGDIRVDGRIVIKFGRNRVCGLDLSGSG
jgi:hypothetical protein